MKTVLKISISAFMIAVAFIGSLFLATHGEYLFVPLVTENPALPSEMIADVKLHVRIVEGPANSATVIVLHGGPRGDFRSLQGLDASSDAYRIVYDDQRGAGLSERVESYRLTLAGHIADCWSLSGTSRPLRQKQTSMLLWKDQIWPRN